MRKKKSICIVWWLPLRYSHSRTNINYFHFNMRQKDLLFLSVLVFFYRVCRHISSNSSIPFFQWVWFCYSHYSACVNTVILFFYCPLSLMSIQFKLNYISNLLLVDAFLLGRIFFSQVFEKSDNLRLMIIIFKQRFVMPCIF